MRKFATARVQRRNAFTVLELLVVLAIIGVLAAISLPYLKGINQSNTLAAANRQLIDDLALARQRAISGRATVHVVFVPPSISSMAFNPSEATLMDRLTSGQFTTYALFAERTVGDQPGRPTFRYLSKWKTLPEGVFIATNEFNRFNPPELWTDLWKRSLPTNRPFHYIDYIDKTMTKGFPFPTSTSVSNSLPHLAFSPQGNLVSYDNDNIPRDEYIELARGTIFSSRDQSTGQLRYFEARENPPKNSISNYNRIHIDALTGRAKVERPEIP